VSWGPLRVGLGEGSQEGTSDPLVTGMERGQSFQPQKEASRIHISNGKGKVKEKRRGIGQYTHQ